MLCCVLTPRFTVASLTIDYKLVTEILFSSMKHVAGNYYDNYTCILSIIASSASCTVLGKNKL